MVQAPDISWIALDAAQRAAVVSTVCVMLARRSWVVAAWWHGSSVAADAPARDIDIGVLAEGRGSVAQALELQAAAAEVEVACGLREGALDMRLVNGASPVFLGRMLDRGKLVYEADAEARATFEAQSVSRWLDYKPVWERLRRAYLSSDSDG